MVWDESGKSYVDMLGGIAVNAARPRPPGRGRGGDPADRDPRPCLQPLRGRADGGPGRGAAGPGRPPGAGRSSPTPAPRPTRPPSSSPGGPGAPTWSRPRGAFHGRTMGALALTGQPAKADPFRPLPGDVTHVPYGDVERARRGGRRRDTAMVILEPIQGENGVIVPPAGYLAAAREITAAARRAARARRGADRHRPYRPLVRPPGRRRRARTSSPWPRGSAAGCRSAPAWSSATAADLLGPGSHGSTFGGNPVCLRGRAGGARHDRERGPARPREAARRAAAARHRGAGPSAGRRGAGRRAAARYRAHRAGLGRASPTTLRAAGLPRPTPSSPTRSGWPRR